MSGINVEYYYFCRGTAMNTPSIVKFNRMKKIFSNIIHKFKEDSLSKREELKDRVLEYKELAEVKSSVVFWSAEMPNIDILLDKLSVLLGKNMMKVCFIPDKVISVVPVNTLSLRNEDLGFGGKILNQELLKLLENRFDVLIDLSSTSTTLCDYVLKNIQASCKIGIEKEGFQNDIILVGVENENDFIVQLEQIWKNLKKY